jgi:anaerobic ribonucleoside-triphosphate reductase
VNEERIETKQERREKKLKKKRERMPTHGKNLARVYVDAILKRLKHQRAKD